MSIFVTALKIIGISILVLVGLGLSYQYIATKLDKRKYPPVGKLIDIGGYKLHMIDSGVNHTGPVIVMDGGAGACALDWALVQPEIAKFARVITYDRAGYGWSDTSPLPRTSENIVEELRIMLKNDAVQGPYILVGHSFGGFNMQLFAVKYPDDVAGVILVDSSNEDTFEKVQKYFTVNKSLMWMSLGFSYLGVMRLIQQITSVQTMMKKSIEKYPALIQVTLTAHRLSTSYMLANIYEGLYMEQNSQMLKLIGKPLGNIPLTVVSAGKPMMEKGIKGIITEEKAYQVSKAWFEIQADLVKKSSRGVSMIAENSGHNIPYEQPEIIIDAVREMYEELSINS